MKIVSTLLNNFGLKALSLFLAFITLVYVGETAKTGSDDTRTVLQRIFSRSDMVSKKMTVQPIFVGTPPRGYAFVKDKVKVIPESIVVICPAKYILDKENIFTKPIDLSEHTKDKTVSIGLEAISRSIRAQDLSVQVYLPVERAKEIE